MSANVQLVIGGAGMALLATALWTLLSRMIWRRCGPPPAVQAAERD